MHKDSILLKLAAAFFVPPLALVLIGFAFFAAGHGFSISFPLAVVFLGISALGGFALGYALIYRKILSLTNYLRDQERAEGDLTKRMPVAGKDELSAVGRNHNIFVSQIHQIVFKLKNIIRYSDAASRELAQKSLKVATSLREITATSQAMSVRENELNGSILASRENIRDIRGAMNNIVDQIDAQASSVNQSSAAVEETIASIRNIDAISQSKSRLASSLKTLASEGGENMQKTLEAMEGIADSVTTVTDLITVINDVAEKTNMLAMNAAIEAAHAGEHGKGFSVVADEIRALAETTAQNAKEVGDNLTSMVREIESSRKLTVMTGQSITQLIGGIKEVSDSLSEITGGLSEMSSGTAEITSALTQLISITQEVKTNSKMIDRKSAEIDTIMTKVIDISSETMSSMNVFTDVVQEIKTATDAISRAGAANAENIAIADREVSRFRIIDTSSLVSSDGQTLIQWNKIKKEIPTQPANPRSLPETEITHWYNLEYAGWHTQKKNIPASPADGAVGKRVLLLESCDHPYHTSYKSGCAKVAKAFGVALDSLNANYSSELQAKQVDQAIREKPDLIIVTPTSVKESTNWFKKINAKNIPVIGSNTTPNDEGFEYIAGWTGPDDWGQFRLLAREFASRMGNKGGYGIVRHAVGNSNYFSRTWSIITELKKIAPEMECLAMETAIKEDETRKLVGSWLQKYGTKIKGLCFSDPADGAKGLCKAVRDAGRSDIVVVSSGNSAVTQDLVKSGQIHAITYQSAEADGALAMEMAIDWFNGMEIEPIRYLPMKIITAQNVADFYPAQW